MDISIDAFIPENYIENPAQRIDAYRKIASIMGVQDSKDVVEELVDRYGEPPKSVMGLVNVALTRNRALHLKITEIVQRGEKVFFYIAQPEIYQIQALLAFYKNRVRFNDKDKAYFTVRLDKKQQSHELMAQVIDIMSGSEDKSKEVSK